MRSKLRHTRNVVQAASRTILAGPQALAFVPALTLAGFWLGGEGLLVLLALLLPASFALVRQSRAPISWDDMPRDGLTGLPLRQSALERLDRFLQNGTQLDLSTACMALRMDRFEDLGGKHAQAFRDTVLMRVAERLKAAVRGKNLLTRLEGPNFAVVLDPIPGADLETLIQLSARIQGEIANPIVVEGVRVYATVSIGFCQLRHAPDQTGEAVMTAAGHALGDAAISGPGAIRAYTQEIHRATVERTSLTAEVEHALANGEICAWFQPQVSTDTGQLTGFEALARWNHPNRGIVPPADFLSVIEDGGLSERLGEVVLYNACAALREWDKAGITVPRCGVNFSPSELRNPRLVDKIKWELDRFDLEPTRLGIEILETVMSQESIDAISRNIWALQELGCLIELDDFGTGSASIANIRRFAVGRIKIDRSFITHLDTDREQQNMVAAILTMAERLDLETLGEGVETAGEHAMLAQLGCGHVQGFSIGRPMPIADTFAWYERHKSKVAQAPQLAKPTTKPRSANRADSAASAKSNLPQGRPGKTA
ncbi:MAG: EAL domain-containing protein [Rhodobacteraceae bacterium]|nr:EAL domain-containing protein [Paracoccaceae bacterium]